MLSYVSSLRNGASRAEEATKFRQITAGIKDGVFNESHYTRLCETAIAQIALLGLAETAVVACLRVLELQDREGEALPESIPHLLRVVGVTLDSYCSVIQPAFDGDVLVGVSKLQTGAKVPHHSSP